MDSSPERVYKAAASTPLDQALDGLSSDINEVGVLAKRITERLMPLVRDVDVPSMAEAPALRATADSPVLRRIADLREALAGSRRGIEHVLDRLDI